MDRAIKLKHDQYRAMTHTYGGEKDNKPPTYCAAFVWIAKNVWSEANGNVVRAHLVISVVLRDLMQERAEELEHLKVNTRQLVVQKAL